MHAAFTVDLRVFVIGNKFQVSCTDEAFISTGVIEQILKKYDAMKTTLLEKNIHLNIQPLSSTLGSSNMEFSISFPLYSQPVHTVAGILLYQ